MQINIPIDISDPPKRKPPARFAAYVKTEDKSSVNEESDMPRSSSNQIDTIENEKPTRIRSIANPLFTDNTNASTKETCIEDLKTIYPEFNGLSEVIMKSPKWQEKVDALSTFESYIQKNASLFKGKQESVIQFILLFSKDFKVANMNLLKAAFSLASTIISCCGAGPKACSPIIDSCVAKIHDKKLNGELMSLLSLISEKISPNTVISQIATNMEKSRIPAQQNSILSFFSSIIQEFGAIHLDLKLLLPYVIGPNGLGNSKPEVKENATKVICQLYQQCGDVVKMMVQQSELNDLLKKKVMEQLDTTIYDPALSKQYSSSNQKPASTKLSHSNSAVLPEEQPVFSFSDFIQPVDITAELQPILKQLRFCEGKESWKVRQEGVESLIRLIEKKRLVVNNRSVNETISVLKDRLSETNLNLRAKVLLCLKNVLESIGDEKIHYTSLLVPELMQLTNETKQNVLDALYAVLQCFMKSSSIQSQLFNSIAPFFPQGLKLVKGRLLLLQYINQWISLIERKPALQLVSSIMDCIADRSSAVRSEAGKTMKVLCSLVSMNEMEKYLKGRPSPDLKAIHAVIDGYYETSKRGSDALPSRSSAELSEPNASLSNLNERKQSLAMRSGARILSKPKPGTSMKDRFSNVKSSIPKPMPRQFSQSGTQSYIRYSRQSDISMLSDISMISMADSFFISHPSQSKIDREQQDPTWTVENHSLQQLKEECYGIVTLSNIDRMFHSDITLATSVLEDWTALLNNDYVQFIEVIDIILKYTSLLLISIPEYPPLMKFFDDLFFMLIEKNYSLSNIELQILLSAFIQKSGSSDFKIRSAIKEFYQSVVACANRTQMMEILIGTIQNENEYIRQTTLIFFREMIAYSEVKQVLHDHLKLLVLTTEDKDIECRTHARQLCKEALQERAYSYNELAAYLPLLSGLNRDFISSLVSESLSENDMMNIPDSSSFLPSITSEQHDIKENIKDKPIEYTLPTDHTPLILDSVMISDSHLFDTIQYQPLQDSSSFPSSPLDSYIQQLYQFDEILHLIHSPTVFEDYFINERKKCLQTLHQLASVLQTAIDFSVHIELAESLVLLLASLLYHSKRLFNLSNSLDFNLLSSFIQLLLYLLSLPSFQSFSQLGLNQLICYILDCYYPEHSSTDNSIKQINQRYQQILVKICQYSHVTSLFEILIQIANHLEKQENGNISANLIEGMLKRLRKQVLPNLMQGDYIQLLEVFQSSSSIYPSITEEITMCRSVVIDSIQSISKNKPFAIQSTMNLEQDNQLQQVKEESERGVMAIQQKLNEIQKTPPADESKPTVETTNKEEEDKKAEESRARLLSLSERIAAIREKVTKIKNTTV